MSLEVGHENADGLHTYVVGRIVQTKNTAVSKIRLEMDLMYFYIVCTCFARDSSLLKPFLSGSPISMPHCSCMFSHCQKLAISVPAPAAITPAAVTTLIFSGQDNKLNVATFWFYSSACNLDVLSAS